MRFGNLPIRRKVSAVIFLIVGLAIGLSFLGTFFLQAITFQERAESELITLASMVGESVNSAIFFEDTAEAARVLEHLRAQRLKHRGETTEVHILRLPHRDIFASTPAGAEIPAELFSKGIGIYSTGGAVWLIHELKDTNDRIFAHIMVHSSLSALHHEQRNLLLLLMAVFLMTLVVAYYLGRRLQLNLTFPISSLASTVQQIAEKGNHALRAQRFSNDEVGVLTGHVNHMLDTLDAQALALQESEALFRSQFEYGNIGIAITSIEKGWLKANTCLCNMLGYTAEELLKKTWPEMTHPDDLAADLAQYARMLKGEIEKYEMDKRFVRKDRNIIHTHLTVSCFRNPDGSVKFAIASLLDITERKRAEEALAESKRALETLLSNMPGMAYRSRNDRDWTMEYVSEGAKRLTGYAPSDFVGNAKITFTEIQHPDDRERVWDEVQRSLERREKFVLQYRIRRADGKERWVWEQGQGVFSPKSELLALEGLIMDITDRKHAEEERERLIIEIQRALTDVSRSQKEWQDTFDNIKDMISIHDRDYTVIRANKAFSQNLGMQPAEVIGRKCHELMHHGAVSPLGGCPHQRTMEDGKQATEEVYDELTGRTLLVTTFPYNSPVGSIIGTIHIARDITEEKEREMKMIMTERLASLGQMAAGIAHEINNPLASVMICSEMLLMKMAKDQYDHAQFEKYLRTIDEEVQRCRDITTNMLSFARQTSTENQNVDIQVLLDKAVDLVGFQGRLKNVSVKKRYGPKVTVNGNEGELRQVFLALVVNALDAMESKGVLTLETGQEGSFYRVSISDTGPGIPEDIRQKIFHPFFTTKSGSGGTGLGLSIAHRIVANHQGVIDVTSERGSGATFTVSFPC